MAKLPIKKSAAKKASPVKKSASKKVVTKKVVKVPLTEKISNSDLSSLRSNLFK